MISDFPSMRSFKHRNFRILFAANAMSNIGTWAQRIAQDWLVLELTHSGRDLGLVTGLQFLPALLLSMYGGSLADRFNKRKLLMITNLGGGVSSLLLGVLIVTHTVSIWHVFMLALSLGVFSSIDAPVRQSFNSEVVGKSDIANAISLNSANFNAGRLVGPGLSGLMISWFGTGPSFIFNSISYIFVLGGLSLIKESDLFIEHEPKAVAKISEAIRYVRSRKDIVAVMVTVFFTATFGLNFQIFNALMATKVFGKGAASYGSMGSVVAIGSLTGALLSAKLDRKHGPRFVMFFASLFGASEILLSFMPSYDFYLFILPLCGAFALTTLIAANSFVQTTSDPHLRGRVMGIYLMIFMGGTPFGSPFIGWLSTSIGVRQTVTLCGSVTVLAALGTAFIVRNSGKSAR
ncbi:MAG: MFS transporter [Actinomycetes bacterium]